MFFFIKQATETTTVYQYDKPSRAIQHAAKTKHPQVEYLIGLLLLVPGMVLVLDSMYQYAIVSSYDHSDATLLRFCINMAPGFLVGVVGLILLGNGLATRSYRRQILAQEMREHYVTGKDWSFKVMFPNGSVIDLSNPVLKSAIDEFFADTDVIKADKLIRKSEGDAEKKKAVKEYEAKIRVINLAQTAYVQQRITRRDILDEFARQRAVVDKEMHAELQEALHAFDAKRRSIQELVTQTQPGAVTR